MNEQLISKVKALLSKANEEFETARSQAPTVILQAQLQAQALVSQARGRVMAYEDLLKTLEDSNGNS